MTLPVAWDTVRVYGRYFDFRSGAPARGMLQFVPTRRVSVADAGSRTIIMPTPQAVSLDAAGEFSIQLPITDDPDLDQSGWHWQCTERVGGVQRVYYFDLPLSSGDLDIATAVPLQPADNLQPGPPGPTGPMGSTGPAGATGPQGPAGPGSDIPADTHAALSKVTPADADELPLVDSADSWSLKKLTWANFKATAKTYFDTLYLSLTGGTLTGDVAVSTPETSKWWLSTEATDFGTYIDNTMQLGFNCRGGTRAEDTSEIAWYLQWENKFLNGAEGYICEWHLNYIGTDGTQRRLFLFDANRGTHKTRAGINAHRFYVEKPDGHQVFTIGENNRIAINSGSAGGTLHIFPHAASDVPLMIEATDSHATSLLQVRRDDVVVVEASGVADYVGWVKVKAPPAQTNGARLTLESNGKQTFIGLDSSSSTSIVVPERLHTTFYRGFHLYDANLSGEEVFSVWEGNVTASRKITVPVLVNTTKTVATLPSAASSTGARAFVTDATATTFASVVAGGGSNGVPVYSDGTNWRVG